MRILADESVEGEVVARLRSEGHDVAYIPETSAGIRDDEVLARANAEDRVLLTEDKDFGDLAFFYGNRSSGMRPRCEVRDVKRDQEWPNGYGPFFVRREGRRGASCGGLE